MDYETDTLTSAQHNRAASQRYYHQVMMPSRSFVVQESPVMLHRSASGARRKIRQKREQEASRPSPFLSPSSSSVNSSSVTSSPTPDDGAHYRSVIDSGSYQSILPDLPDLDTSYSPQPQPRLIRSSFSSSMSSLDVVNAAVPQPQTPQHSKPTVEVHPMPVDERSSSREDMDMPRKEKPAVPAKPKGLLVDHMNRSTSLSSLAPPVASTTSAFLHNLSPSQMSLHKSYRSSEFGSSQEIYHEKRLQPISENSRRISSLDEERDFQGDFGENDRVGHELIQLIHRHNAPLAAKIREHVSNLLELLQMETKQSYEMDRLVHRLNHSSGEERTDALQAESWYRNRSDDLKVLRAVSQRRQRDIDGQLARLLNDYDFRVWQSYLERTATMVRESKQIDRSFESPTRGHLRQINNMRPSM